MATKKQKPPPAPPATRGVDFTKFQRRYEESLLRRVDVYDPDTGWRDEAEVDEINKECDFLKGILDEERKEAARGKKFPSGSTKGRLAWQRAVTAFAATRLEADHVALLQALEHGAVPKMLLIPDADRPTCNEISRKARSKKVPGKARKILCAAGAHFHYASRDTVSRDQVLRYLRRLRPPAPRPPARWSRRPQK